MLRFTERPSTPRPVTASVAVPVTDPMPVNGVSTGSIVRCGV
jgi:hypothetical protein